MDTQDDTQERTRHASQQNGWEDDVLDRRGFAEFLTKALSEQTKAVSTQHGRGLTIALDAGWGAGKTFFTKPGRTTSAKKRWSR
jgi:hypothetical protein